MPVKVTSPREAGIRPPGSYAVQFSGNSGYLLRGTGVRRRPAKSSGRNDRISVISLPFAAFLPSRLPFAPSARSPPLSACSRAKVTQRSGPEAGPQGQQVVG